MSDELNVDSIESAVKKKTTKKPQAAGGCSAAGGSQAVAIEDLKASVDAAVFAGVCEQQDWKPGKKVTQKVWGNAVAYFNDGAMGRRSK